MVFSDQREEQPTPPKSPDGGGGKEGGNEIPKTLEDALIAKLLGNQWDLWANDGQLGCAGIPTVHSGAIPQPTANHANDNQGINDKKSEKGKNIMSDPDSNITPKVWIRKRQRKDSGAGPSSGGGNVPKLDNGPLTQNQGQNARAITLPIINRAEPIQNKTEGPIVPHLLTWKDGVTFGAPEKWPKKPPDLAPEEKKNGVASMETFQDCEEVVMDCFSDFSILAWNIKGARSSRGKRYVKELISSHRPSVCFILETHCPFNLEENFWHNLGFDLMALVEAQNHSEGVWILKDRSVTCRLDVIDHGNTSWIGSTVYASPVPTSRENLWMHICSI
ncbi:Endonuclease/exonuclease/phosphatase superfamily [Sesbania bispinosa]|nr:Endonuclease/exonuclease/phosphatase superfamily [Sesbania bispinosa]